MEQRIIDFFPREKGSNAEVDIMMVAREAADALEDNRGAYLNTIRRSSLVVTIKSLNFRRIVVSASEYDEMVMDLRFIVAQEGYKKSQRDYLNVSP